MAYTQTLSTGLDPQPTALILATLDPLQSIEGALFGLAAAAGIAAICMALIRGVLMNSDSTNAATVARIMRILALVALIGSMTSILMWAYSALSVGSGLAIQGMTTIAGGF